MPPGESVIRAEAGQRNVRPTERTPVTWQSQWLLWTATGVSAAIIALYFGLVPLGQWQADEYDYFARLRWGLWDSIVTRLRWSPRPLSEALYAAYGLAANHLHRPLTSWFLGLLWLGFAACACTTAVSFKRIKQSFIPPLVVGLGLAATFLTSGPLFQVFYWPAGAVAYLPTLSAMLLLFLQVLYGQLSSPRGRLVCFLCLLTAALSSEMGAIFVVCFAALQAGILIFRRSDERFAWWLLPGIVSAGVLLWVATHRIPAAESAFTVPSAAFHRPMQSAFEAGRQLALEILGWGSGTKHALSALANLFARVALAGGVALLLREPRSQSESREPGDHHQLLALGGAFLAAAFVTLFASYLHFGTAGGERYETIRRCWIVMSYISAAVALVDSQWWQRHAIRPVFAPVLLIAGILLPWHVSPLMRQYAGFVQVRNAIAQTFHSGYQPGTDQMELVLPLPGGVITPARLQPGTYTRTSQPSAFHYAVYILTYFDKQVLVVLPAEKPQFTIASPAP